MNFVRTNTVRTIAVAIAPSPFTTIDFFQGTDSFGLIVSEILREFSPSWFAPDAAFNLLLGFEGEAAEIVPYTFDLLMLRGKDVPFWPFEGRRGRFFEIARVAFLNGASASISVEIIIQSLSVN